MMHPDAQPQPTPELAAALARAQLGFRRIKRTERSVEGFMFASLAGYLDAVRKPLAAEGIALLLPARPVLDETGAAVAVAYVTLLHSSGERLDGERFEMPITDPSDPASIAGACTLARKSALGFIGIHPEGEGDAQEAFMRRASDAREAARKPETAPAPLAAAPAPAAPPAAAAAPSEPSPDEPSQAQKAADLYREARVHQIVQDAKATGVEDVKLWIEQTIGHPYERMQDLPEHDLATLELEIRARADLGGGAKAEEPPKPQRKKKEKPAPVADLIPRQPDGPTVDDVPRKPLQVVDYQDAQRTPAPAGG